MTTDWVEWYHTNDHVYFLKEGTFSLTTVPDLAKWGKLSPHDYAYQVRQRNPSMQVKRITE